MRPAGSFRRRDVAAAPLPAGASRTGLLALLAALVAMVGATHAIAQGGRAQATAAVAADGSETIVSATVAGDGSRDASGAVDRPGISIAGGRAVSEVEAGGTRRARATATATGISLLDGLVTAAEVRRTADARAGDVAYSGVVRDLRIGGVAVAESLRAGRAFSLPGGEGTVGVNVEGAGLVVALDAEVAGRPAGTRIVVSRVQASAPRPAQPKAAPVPEPETTAPPSARSSPAPGRATGPRDEAEDASPRRVPSTPPQLTPGRYAFPVYGEASVSDSFGAPRPQGSHEGNDIFADFGAPVLAVADGTLEKVGTLPVSGNRLWLRTDAGDTFFYAHLSAFAPIAADGRRVRAGTVVGFNGNTGDAETTPPHVHFEIHPGDGPAIDPYDLLTAWQAGRDAAPALAGGPEQARWLARYGDDTSPRPGALVPVRDFIAER